MENFNRKKHWETIYETKALNEVSWYQSTPETSLNFIEKFQLPIFAKIIDVGGGDSFLVDHLLDLGYENITILDISDASLKRARQRLGDKAKKVKWLVADAAQFQPTEQYDFWHDRAAFHFLTQPKEINNYIATVQQGLRPNGVLVIGTFSKEGPKKCSGIDIKQYSETTMTNQFKKYFKKINCITVNHLTPFDTLQNFVFCSFRKKKII